MREGLLDLAAGVQDRAVVPAAEIGADLLQRQLGQLAGQIHADLARQQHAARSTARLELSRLDLEIAADTLGDAFHGRLAGRRLDAEIVGDRLDTERLTVQARQARQAGDGPFELANAAGDMLG